MIKVFYKAVLRNIDLLNGSAVPTMSFSTIQAFKPMESTWNGTAWV